MKQEKNISLAILYKCCNICAKQVLVHLWCTIGKMYPEKIHIFVIVKFTSMLYNYIRNSKEDIVMWKLADGEQIGTYLKKLVKERYNDSTVAFCRDYIKLTTNPDESTRNLENRFSQIFKGKKNIQIYDLPILSEIFIVSCEEILSAGKCCKPVSNRTTNYEIAQSNDRAVWDKYMKRSDRLFLNHDEYYKSVIDYALDFKNYKFIKYLLEEKFIWFENYSSQILAPSSYGAGTSIKPNWERFDLPDQFISHELITEEKRLRNKVIALAIENEDHDILEYMSAREIPQMNYINIFENCNIDFNENRDIELIETIASSENKKILEYFSDEFLIQELNSKKERNNTFIFIFLGDVIELMLENKKYEFAEVLLKKAIIHSKNTFNAIKDMITEACRLHNESIQEEIDRLIKLCIETDCSKNDEMVIKNLKQSSEDHTSILSRFNFNPNNNIVSFNYFHNNIYSGMVTNILKISSAKGSPEIRALIDELNEWYHKILLLGGEKNAEILL